MIWDSVTIGYVGLRGVNKPLASLNNHLINEMKNEAGSCHEHWSWRANKLKKKQILNQTQLSNSSFSFIGESSSVPRIYFFEF